MQRLRRLLYIATALVFVLTGTRTAFGQDTFDDDARERLWGRGGFTPLFGGLPQTAGTTLGVRYDTFLRHPNLTLAADARGSLRRYAGLQLLGGYQDEQIATFGFGRYTYMPGELFYGMGPGTSNDSRGDFRLDEYAYGGIVGARLTNLLSVGVHVSHLDIRFGEGRLDDVLPVEEAFDPVPALATDTRYVPLGLWVELDTRRLPRQRRYGARTAGTAPIIDGHALGTGRGYYLSAEIRPTFGLTDVSTPFTHWQAEAQYFHPLSFGADALVLRTHVQGMINDGEPIPFYMLPFLGGSHSIRGFAPARFRDHNAWVANVEYRRSLFMFVDAAVFVDAGQVFDETADLSFRDTEFGYGLGLLARMGPLILGRMDIAHSRDGFRVYLRAGTFL